MTELKVTSTAVNNVLCTVSNKFPCNLQNKLNH